MRRAILLAVIAVAGLSGALLLSGQVTVPDTVPDGGLAAFLPDRGPDGYGTAHRHLYFRAVIRGERVNFSRDRFQLQARKVHLEGGNGEIVHVHADDVTLDFFLQTLGMRRNASCLSVDRVYCTNATHEFRVYIGGNVSASPGDHELEQGENILLWYGRKGEKPDMRFFDRRLPRAYRPSSPGTKV